MKVRRWFLFAAVLLTVAGSMAAALAAVAWNSFAARGGEWSHPVRFTLAGRVFEQNMSMAVLLRAATHPLAARVVDGRSLTTAQGRWQLSARPDGSIAARCEPCRFSMPALGPQPLIVERAELVVHNDGADRYRGTLQLGQQRTITLEGRTQFDRAGQIAIEAKLPTTPMADAVHVLGSGAPERNTVQVKGTLALTLSAKTQRGPWRIKPVVEGFEVAGLDTERLADMQRPAACRVDARRSVPTINGWLPRAVIAAEDARFAEHPGYDLQALTDALQHNQKAGAAIAGASTLTQQLAKLVVAGDERSASRKLRELLYAVEMERTLGKARILQLYLALAPWGDGVCGAERAVRVHLGQRDASTVGPVAAAWLASLLPAPDAYLKSEQAALEVDQARVSRVIDAIRPMSPDRRDKAQVALLFWSPPALTRLREAAPPPAPATPTEALQDVSTAPATATAETPPVAPSP
jgi:hypothetical protein